jgi:lysophospholipase L1-like esterase
VTAHRAQLAVLAASLLACLAGAETVVRVVYGRPVHFRYPQEFYRPDPEIGHWLEPGQRSFTHDRAVATNSLGLRDREFLKRVPEGTKRVLALGDSQTYGEGLDVGDTWPKQLERRLSEAPASLRWEVINAGISGTDTWQHERILDRLAASYDFDVAVLGFYVNDVTPIYETSAARTRTNTAAKRAIYVLKRSALFSLFWGAYQSLVRGADVATAERQILDGTPSERVRAGWEQVDRSIGAMKARCDQAGARLVVAVLPRRDQVQGAQPARAYDRRIAEIAQQHGIAVIDLLDPLRAAYAQHGERLFLSFDGHNSAVANRVVSDQLAESLRAIAR